MRRSSAQKGFPMLTSALGEEILQLLQPRVTPRTFSIYRLFLLKFVDLVGDVEVSSTTPQNVGPWKNRAGVIVGNNPLSKATDVRVAVKTAEGITQEDHEGILKCVKGAVDLLDPTTSEE